MNFYDMLDDIGYPLRLYSKVIDSKRVYTYFFYVKGKIQFAPKWELKIIQKILKNYITDKYSEKNISNNARAYIRGKNISYNVEAHIGNSYFFVSDFKNFFPSIKIQDVKPTLEEIFKEEDEEFREDLYKIIFYEESLQYGFPTSPIISNFIMFKFDKEFDIKLKEKYSEFNIVYTRYCDDITISSRYKIQKNEILNILNNVIELISYNFLKINTKKTRIFEKYSNKPYITGLVPLKNRVSIGKKKYNNLRLNIYLLMRKQEVNIPNFYKSFESLASYLSYLYLVDRHNYNRLKFYFFKKYKDDNSFYNELKNLFRKE